MKSHGAELHIGCRLLAAAVAAAATRLGPHEAGAAGHERGGRPLAVREARPARRVLGLPAAGVRRPALGNVDARRAAHAGGGAADTLAGGRDPLSRPARRLGAAAGAVSCRLAGRRRRARVSRQEARPPLLSRCGRGGGGQGALGRAARRGRPSEHALPGAGAAAASLTPPRASAAPRFRGVSREEICALQPGSRRARAARAAPPRPPATRPPGESAPGRPLVGCCLRGRPHAAPRPGPPPASERPRPERRRRSSTATPRSPWGRSGRMGPLGRRGRACPRREGGTWAAAGFGPRRREAQERLRSPGSCGPGGSGSALRARSCRQRAAPSPQR